AARDLAGETNMRGGPETQRLVEELRRIDEGVAVEAAEPREFGMLEGGNGAEQPDLLGMLELGLEPDHVPQGAERIVLAELDDCMGPAPCARIVEADRLHRAVTQRILAPFRHHLDRHAALEIGSVLLPLPELGLVALQQTLAKSQILLLR